MTSCCWSGDSIWPEEKNVGNDKPRKRRESWQEKIQAPGRGGTLGPCNLRINPQIASLPCSSVAPPAGLNRSG